MTCGHSEPYLIHGLPSAKEAYVLSRTTQKLLDRLESGVGVQGRPVVAALRGECVNIGLELALAWYTNPPKHQIKSCQ